MKGYIYTNKEKAIESRKKLADYKGLPNKEGDVTMYWVDFFYSETHCFWCIKYIEGLELVLGQPIDDMFY